MHKNGFINVGLWENDTQIGIGYEIMGDSCFYFGDFNNGKKNGIGVYKWSDNNKYEGEIKNNFLMVMECIYIMMVGNIVDIGKKIIWMDMVK